MTLIHICGANILEMLCDMLLLSRMTSDWKIAFQLQKSCYWIELHYCLMNLYYFSMHFMIRDLHSFFYTNNPSWGSFSNHNYNTWYSSNFMILTPTGPRFVNLPLFSIKALVCCEPIYLSSFFAPSFLFQNDKRNFIKDLIVRKGVVHQIDNELIIQVW